MRAAETETLSTEGSFRLSSRRLDQGILFEVAGEVDLASAPIVEAELRRAEESADLILLDLCEVSFMDSTGLRMVISADQRLRERGASLRLVHVPAQVLKLFRLVGIADRLTIDERLDAGSDPAEKS